MRPLTSHWRDEALTTLETVLQQTKEARVFRRAPAVRAGGAGHHGTAVSAPLHFTTSARRPWVPRLAHQGGSGLVERPRPGRPRKVTCARAPPLNRLVAQDPLRPGALSSQW